MIFEDAHWSDPSSQEVLGLAMQQLVSDRVLLIITFRPEFESRWTGAQVTTLTLDRLPVGDVGTMIDGVAGGTNLRTISARRLRSGVMAFLSLSRK